MLNVLRMPFEKEDYLVAGSTVIMAVISIYYSRYGPFPMMYWPWDRIGENMQLCLAGLRDVDRSVEIYICVTFHQRLIENQNAIHALPSLGHDLTNC